MWEGRGKRFYGYRRGSAVVSLERNELDPPQARILADPDIFCSTTVPIQRKKYTHRNALQNQTTKLSPFNVTPVICSSMSDSKTQSKKLLEYCTPLVFHKMA